MEDVLPIIDVEMGPGMEVVLPIIIDVEIGPGMEDVLPIPGASPGKRIRGLTERWSTGLTERVTRASLVMGGTLWARPVVTTFTVTCCDVASKRSKVEILLRAVSERLLESVSSAVSCRVMPLCVWNLGG